MSNFKHAIVVTCKEKHPARSISYFCGHLTVLGRFALSRFGPIPVCPGPFRPHLLIVLLMRNSLKKRLFAPLYSILVISCTFALVQKKYFLLFLCGFL